jgi:O-antigen ligase
LDDRYSPLKERVGPFFYFCAFGLVSSLLLGGGTRGGFLSDAILQFLSVPVLMAALWRVMDAPLSRDMRLALAFCAAILAIPLAQLLPLPPAIWTNLPGRETAVATFELIGRDPPWAPLSMSPGATWLSALSLLPPLAVFLGALQLSYRERRWLCLVVLGVGLVSVFIGLMQVAQGPSSPLRFFENTNPDDTVGFFANRNHFAALLYSLTLLAAAWAANNATTIGLGHDRKKFDTASIVMRLASFSVLVVLIAAQVMARSRAGLILTIVALFGAFALAQWDQRAAKGVTPVRLMLGAATLAIVFSVQFALYRVMDRFSADPLADARIAFARNTIEAAKAVMPFGAGLGAFVPVYAMFEKPRDIIIGAYANHAHDDFLELWLESGMAGPILIGAFAIWLVWRSARVWRRSYHEGLEIDRFLARAASLIIALLLAHSLVDYPLRTGAMMAILAFVCALLVAPPISSPDAERDAVGIEEEAPKRHRRHRASAAMREQLSPVSAPPVAGPAVSPSPSRPRRAPWGEDAEWPEEWRRSSAGKPSPGVDRKPPGGPAKD